MHWRVHCSGVPSLSFGGRQQQAQQQPQQYYQQQQPTQHYQQQQQYSPDAERVRAQQQHYEDESNGQGYYSERASAAAAAPSSSSNSFAASPYASAKLGGTGEGNFVATSSRERMKEFHSTRTNTLRPIVFQPNGSFRALKENGKLAVGPEEASVYKGRIKNPLSETSYHLPVSSTKTQQIACVCNSAGHFCGCRCCRSCLFCLA
jgi:hypothetical protein